MERWPSFSPSAHGRKVWGLPFADTYWIARGAARYRRFLPKVELTRTLVQWWARSVKLKMAPRGWFASTHSRPPWASTMERQMESPMPTPLAFVV
jgi:hypothetical protein